MTDLITSETGRQFLIGGIACTLLAFALINYIFKTQRRFEASATWPKVDGLIVESELFHGKAAPGKGPNYAPQVRYEYKVGDTQYESRRIGLISISGSNRVAATNILKAYPKGSQVSVWYDPTKPSYSVLNREAPTKKESRFLWFIVVILLISGVANTVVTWPDIF